MISVFTEYSSFLTARKSDIGNIFQNRQKTAQSNQHRKRHGQPEAAGPWRQNSWHFSGFRSFQYTVKMPHRGPRSFTCVAHPLVRIVEGGFFLKSHSDA
jgi:hypothetical protein